MSKDKTNMLLVISAKGGIGASIISAAFSQVLSKLGRTLYIDLDNGYSFTKEDLDETGNSKLDLLQCDLEDINQLLELAKPLYRFVILDVKSFDAFRNIHLINELSYQCSYTILPISNNAMGLRVTEEFLANLDLDSATEKVMLPNSYSWRPPLTTDSISAIFPIDSIPNFQISNDFFPLIRGTIDEAISAKVENILKKMCPKLFKV